MRGDRSQGVYSCHPPPGRGGLLWSQSLLGQLQLPLLLGMMFSPLTPLGLRWYQLPTDAGLWGLHQLTSSVNQPTCYK